MPVIEQIHVVDHMPVVEHVPVKAVTYDESSLLFLASLFIFGHSAYVTALAE